MQTKFTLRLDHQLNLALAVEAKSKGVSKNKLINDLLCIEQTTIKLFEYDMVAIKRLNITSIIIPDHLCPKILSNFSMFIGGHVICIGDVVHSDVDYKVVNFKNKTVILQPL